MFQDTGLNGDEPANDPEPELHAVGDQTDVGSILRRTRIQSGYTLEQVSQNLNIRLQHLAAIEESRSDDLPGLTYALGFVRAYANFLGLDDHAVAARYKEEVQITPGGGQRLVFPEPVDEARVPKGTLIAISLAAALAIYGVWYFVSSYNAVKMVTVPPVPDRLAPDSVGPKSIRQAAVQDQAADTAPDTAAPQAETAKAETAKPQTAETEAPKVEKPATPKVAAAPPPATSEADNTDGEDSELPTPPADTVNADSAGQEVASVEAPAVDSAPDATATDQPAAAPIAEAPHVPKAYGSDDADVRVVIKADTDSWVQVEGPASDILLSRVLQAGDTYRVPNRDGLTMMTGNAGALEIMVDGQSIGSLGPLGAVRRGIDLAPQALAARNTAVTN